MLQDYPFCYGKLMLHVAQKGPGSPLVQRKSTLDLAEDTIKEKRRRNLLRVSNNLCLSLPSYIINKLIIKQALFDWYILLNPQAILNKSVTLKNKVYNKIPLPEY